MNEIIKNITTYLKKIDHIEFALLFGSVAENNQSSLSDIDIGIHLSKDIDLLELGGINGDLESLSDYKIDIIILNNLFIQDPFFAYQIVANGKLLFERKDLIFINFKTKSLLSFFDAQPFLEKTKESFIKRLNENFGRRNYA